MAKMGRIPRVFDESLILDLARIACTYDEMSAILKCDKKTLMRRFGTIIKNGWEEGRMSLRREQMKAAMGGNIAMLIWLGKQRLGQSEKNEFSGTQTMIVKEKTVDTSPRPTED